MPFYVKTLHLTGAVIVVVAADVAAALMLDYTDWPHITGQLHFLAGIAENWRPPLLWSLLFLGLIVILLLWRLPKLQVSRSTGVTDENRFDRENEARKTLAQILGGAFLLAGLYSSVQTLQPSREGQITDHYTRAIDQLGASDGEGKPNLEVRLGGIYALERVARESDRDYGTIMEVLATYVREHSHREKDNPHLGADIQAILTVLGRRDHRHDLRTLDLADTNLSGAYLDQVDLTKANLHLADLSRSNLHLGDLSGANLIETNLNGSDLTSADLSGAELSGATLLTATLTAAHLSKAVLDLADLTGANLESADLTGADLTFSKLKGARVGGLDLSTTKGLTQQQIDSSLGNGSTKLPPYIKKPASWLDSKAH
jgi:hypothetical protein